MNGQTPTRTYPVVTNRRVFLSLVPSSAFVSHSFSDSKADVPPIRINAIRHTKFIVTDLRRSTDWYQRLFGIPVLARYGHSVVLRIGSGPQYLEIEEDRNATPGIAQIGLAVEEFNGSAIMQSLHRHGLTHVDGATKENAILRKRTRGSASLDRSTSEIILRDPDGIVVELVDARDEGGTGEHGDQFWADPELSGGHGILEIEDYNHFTTVVRQQIPTVAFYRQVFGFPIDTHQGSMPLLRVGLENQFLAFVGGGGRQPNRPSIHHVCFTVDQFDPDEVLQQLSQFGITRRDRSTNATEPLQSYVTMRMPNRGGAVGGTPELYFRDPDGILLQIQDQRYAGGGGYLGDRRGN